MNCWECNRPAHGICKFCGRALCKDHSREKVHIVSLSRTKTGVLEALVTKKALFCGYCVPVGDTVEIEQQKKDA